MANGYFERGEIYWVKMGSGIGAEMNVTRPGLIVSTDKLNTTSEVAIVVFLTTKPHSGSWCGISTFATGRESWIKCDQIQVVDKTRFANYMGKLSPSEMKAVEDGLEDIFDLGYVDSEALAAKDREIADRDLLISEAKAEMVGVRAEVAKRDDEIASLKMEIEMWQKCYGRCMDMLVDTKVNSDLSRRVAPAEPKMVEPKVGTAASMIPDFRPEPPKVEEPPVEEPEQEERLDVNSCTATALKKIGFSLAMARKIVESRPFKSVEDLKRVNGLKSSQFRIMAPKLCCVPVKEVEQPEVTVVEPVVEQERDPGFEKVNVNTASAGDLHVCTGLSMNACYAITGKRKRDGLFTSLDELLMPPRVTEKMLKKCRHLLEV